MVELYQQQFDLDGFNTVMMEEEQETLGLGRRKKEEWISVKTWDMIRKRKASKSTKETKKSPRLMDNLKRTSKTLKLQSGNRMETDKLYRRGANVLEGTLCTSAQQRRPISESRDRPWKSWI